VTVRRPANLETTALGAAFLAGLAEGVWSSPADIGSRWKAAAEFEPTEDRSRAEELYSGWKKAISTVLQNG
jgi:glycerol kinase